MWWDSGESNPVRFLAVGFTVRSSAVLAYRPILADRVRFELTGPLDPAVFKTASVDHSETYPCWQSAPDLNRMPGGTSRFPVEYRPWRLYALYLVGVLVGIEPTWAVTGCLATGWYTWKRASLQTRLRATRCIRNRACT